jgi:pimeloyl-ACP methyl ester carboxylesterase
MTVSELRGFHMAYDVLGEPGATPPFVWGHGLSSSRANEDRFPLIDFGTLSSVRQVVRYDARGHGESDPLDDPRGGSWAELANDQLALIEHLAIDRVALGGASMGTGTALHAALSLGPRLERLVLVIPPTAWQERGAQIANYEQMARVVETRGADALIAAAAELPPPDPFAGRDDWLEHRKASLAAADPARLAAIFRGAAFADLPAADELSTITVPTLVLAWTGDPGHPTSTAERLGELIADAEVVISSTFEQLSTWTECCRDFLTAISS